MSVDPFAARLTAALTESMSSGQRAWLDARIAQTIARTGHGRPRWWQGLPTRTALLAAALLLVVLPSVFVVSAGMLMTESPFGLASAIEFQRELDAAKAVTPIPATTTWPPSLRAQSGTFYSRGGAYQEVESTAMCLWLGEWITADGTDSRRATAAAEVIDRVIEAVTQADRGPVLSYMTLNCSGGHP
jgi:hypothetical protein